MAKTKNPIAKDLRTPKYRKRVTRDKTKYDRKREKDDDRDIHQKI